MCTSRESARCCAPKGQFADNMNAFSGLAAFKPNRRSPVVADAATRTNLAALMEAAGKAAQASDEGKRKLRAMGEGN